MTHKLSKHQGYIQVCNQSHAYDNTNFPLGVLRLAPNFLIQLSFSLIYHVPPLPSFVFPRIACSLLSLNVGLLLLRRWCDGTIMPFISFCMSSTCYSDYLGYMLSIPQTPKVGELFPTTNELTHMLQMMGLSRRG